MPELVHKALNLTLPDNAPIGSVQAVFSTWTDASGKPIVDKQRDILTRAAFQHLDGTEVPLIWSHDWGALPVGKGRIVVQAKQAVFDGAFHLQTQLSRDAHAVTREMGPLQEFSYGFEIAPDGFTIEEQDDGPIRRITKISRVFEVSGVLVGAGENTRVLAIKQADPATIWDTDDSPVGEKPMPNFHACRVLPPSDFQAGTFRTMSRNHEGKSYDVIVGRKKGETTMSTQALRYPSATWTAAQARSHCDSHDGSSFVAATSSSYEPDEAKVGRTISARSEAAIRAAIVALQGLLGEEASADDDGNAKVASLPLAGAVADNQVDPAAVADGLRGWAAWLTAEPLDSKAAEEWLPSMLARIAELQRIAADRRARRGLTAGSTPKDEYERLMARQARLTAVLGKDR